MHHWYKYGPFLGYCLKTNTPISGYSEHKNMDYERQEILTLKPNFRIHHHKVSEKAVKCNSTD